MQRPDRDPTITERLAGDLNLSVCESVHIPFQA